MIFYKPIEISSNYIKIEFCKNFIIGQIVQIIDFGNYQSNDKINSKRLNQPIFGKIVSINMDFVIIETFWSLKNLKISDLVVQVLQSVRVLPFSPTLLGRFWSNFGFLETFWQEEEIMGKLLGSRLLTGKSVEYGQNSPSWQTNINFVENEINQIKLAKPEQNEQINLKIQILNPIFDQIFDIYDNIKLGTFNNLEISRPNLTKSLTKLESNHANSTLNEYIKPDVNKIFLQIINQLKNNFDQPIFLICTESLSVLQLKEFYFSLVETENFFNCFVLDCRNYKFATEIQELAFFLAESLVRKVFIISEIIDGNEKIKRLNQNVTLIQIRIN